MLLCSRAECNVDIAGIPYVLGAVTQQNTVWNTAGVLMSLMSVINIPVLSCLRDYTRQKQEGRSGL